MSQDVDVVEMRDRLSRLRELDTCAVSDALDALGVPGAVLGLHSVTGRHRMAGRAVTIDLVEAGQVDSPRHLGTAAIDASGAGDVIVVAHHGRQRVAGWGGVLSAGARQAGIEGVIVDGAVRDVDEATDLGLPVFAAAGVPVTARGRVVERAWNVPVDVAGVAVSPGDYVVADGSGVVFVPAADIDAVLVKATDISAKERAMVAKVREARPMVEVMGADYENLLKGDR
ncbi:RraA family protein [Nocardia jiangxiensis]|uniref:Putative 4-hydroxy-4-methyl-2-oxoglutarate aldolase n=1 Tax=Nocardia jiangxiensis TaxID=282685 RepID=A0ABW6SF15_9NOCA